MIEERDKMPFRTPGIKLTLDKALFNKLIYALDFNINLNVAEENLSVIATKLKDKLLKYSVPRLSADNVEFVDVRFFQSEAADMIWQLLLLSEKNNGEDYYSFLLNKNSKNE